MRVVVIGAGYVGAELCRQLGAGGHQVFAVTRSGGGGSLACDVSQRAEVARLAAGVGGGIDVAVHCASSGGRGGGPRERAARYRAVYQDGCEHVLAELRPGRLVFAGSTSVYAQTDGSAVDETSPAEPSGGTGQVLLEAERAVLGAGGSVVRLAGIYGPGRWYLLKNFLAGKGSIDGGSPAAEGRWVNQVHRDDAASALAHVGCAAVASGIYNAADDAPRRQRAFYEAFARRFDLPLPPVRPPDLNRARGWTDKRVCNAKLRASGWAPAFPDSIAALDADPGLAEG